VSATRYRYRNRGLSLFALLCLCAPLMAQLSEAKPAPAAVVGSPGGDLFDPVDAVPIDSESFKWNAGLDVTSVHTSTTGWATLATPTVGYRFNDVFSVDAVMPIYFFRLAETQSAKPRPDATLVIQRGEVGDVILSGHALFTPRLAQYQLTGAVAAPSGDEAYGLTSGRVTFDISNEFERTFGRFTPTLELGGGDSSTLVNRLVTKTYTSLGPLAHFQAGVATQVAPRISFEVDAYEQLPLGDQKIYTSKTRKKVTTTVVTGHNVSEDNGFNAAFDATIDRHTVFSSYYSRSLRLHTDTVSVGITYYLRSTAPTADPPLDELLR
jgi:hypothetical protein